ncbi:MAG: hypothetical protein JOZ49_05205 [Mycolicibacterium sp.]|nr:hypothetical protein [Mycolicibacterium sp.]
MSQLLTVQFARRAELRLDDVCTCAHRRWLHVDGHCLGQVRGANQMQFEPCGCIAVDIWDGAKAIQECR